MKKSDFIQNLGQKNWKKIENFDDRNFDEKHLLLHENYFNHCLAAWLCQKSTLFFQLRSKNVKNMWFLAVFPENAQNGSFLRVFQHETPKNHLFFSFCEHRLVLVAYFDQILKFFTKFVGDKICRFFQFFCRNFGLKSDFSTDPTAILSCFNLSEGPNKHG